MNKKLFIFQFALVSLISLSTVQGQQSLPDIEYWIGSGSDTTYVVIDFKDGTPDSSYAWGYLHNGNKTGEEALLAISAADQNLDVNIDTSSLGSFLQDISYHRHEGLGGMPDYWGTWDGNSMDSLSSNTGVATPLVSGGILGCSYMDFNPAVAPGEPWAAFDPEAYQMSQVTDWYGNGTDSTVLIIDFLNGTDTASFAWGFRFNDSIQDVALLDSIANNVAQLSVSISGGVNSISYKNLSGQVGATSDWYAWSGTNHGNWVPHYNPGNYLVAGEMAAFTFNQFLVLERPNVPNNLSNTIGFKEPKSPVYKLTVFPNPATEIVYFEGEFSEVSLFGLGGEKLRSTTQSSLKLAGLKRGAYLLVFESDQGDTFSRKLVVK